MKTTENLIGRKVKGFKFESRNFLGYRPEMDKHIGEVGEVTGVFFASVMVGFKDESWDYPIDQIKEHLLPEFEREL